MGLAGAKNKVRLGNDPNNTKWSRNTETFGQKMLRSQGWEPGQYLGAKDAAHAESYTEANSSHIRVVLKDDNLGLGAKRNRGDECVGLDAFQNLLGRLNGKEEAVIEAEQQARSEVKRNLYLESKIGVIRFVKGGWLVGDIVKEDLEKDGEKSQPESNQDSATTSSSEEAAKSEKISKKRKADRDSDEKPSKKEKSKKRKAESDADSDSEDSRSKKKSKKSKKRKAETEDEEASDGDNSSEVEAKKSRKKKKEDKKRSKEEKKERKEKKEKRRKEKASSGSGAESGDSISREKKRRKEKESASQPAADASSTPTPSGSGYSTPISGATTARYLSRKRFIAQKTMAFSDAAALNQIFMIKS